MTPPQKPKYAPGFVPESEYVEGFAPEPSELPDGGPSQKSKAMPTMGPLHDIGAGVLRLAKRGYDYATSKPEEFIETAGPAAGAALGAAAGAPFGGIGAIPGAAIGATAGYLYGKANRAASNKATGKPVTAGMPQSAGEWGWDIAENVGMNVAPDVAVPAVSRALVRGGRRLVSGALRPPLSSVNDMVEMGTRGTMPQDVRSNIAQDLIDTANEAGLWSPVSDANARRVVGNLQKTHDANTALVRGASEAGETVNMAPVYGAAGGFAEQRVKGGFTPSGDINAVRSRIRQYMSDPASRLTTDYQPGIVANPTGTLASELAYSTKPTGTLANEVVYTSKPGPSLAREVSFDTKQGRGVLPEMVANPGEDLLQGVTFGTQKRAPSALEGIEVAPRRDAGSMLEGIEYAPAPTIRIPNMQADPMDVLTARRMLGGELRGAYGLDATQRASQVMDKSVYRESGDAIKDIAPGLREGMEREHRLMNAAQTLVPTEYLAGNQKPINLYTFLGLASGDPAAITLGISNYPAIQAMAGKAAHNAGARLGGEMGGIGGLKVPPSVTANLLRAALMRQMMSGDNNPER